MCIKDYWRNAMFEMDDADGEMVQMAVPDAARPRAGSAPSSREQPRVRVEFPETWLWSESSTGYHLDTRCYLCSTVHLTEPVLIPGPWLHLATIFNQKFLSR